MTETKTRIPCSQHPKWEWPHCGAPPADLEVTRARPMKELGPDAMPVPAAALEQPYTEDRQLERMLADLIQALPELGWLADYDVRVLWHDKGGDKLGKCILATDLLKFYSKADWIIWIAADHIYTGEVTRSQVRALLYHELKHCVRKGLQLRPGIQKHDVELFVEEVVRFGAWRPELEQLEHAFRLYEGEARGHVDGLLAAAIDVTPGAQEGE